MSNESPQAAEAISKPLTMVDFVAVAASRPKISATLVTIAAVPPKLTFPIFIALPLSAEASVVVQLALRDARRSLECSAPPEGGRETADTLQRRESLA